MSSNSPSSDSTSFEESILALLMRAVKKVNLETIVIGNAAAAIQGVPITTQDVDLFVRSTPLNEQKIKQLVKELGSHVQASRPFEPSSRMIRLEGLPIDVDFVFALSSNAKFESVRSRARVIDVEGISVLVAHLQDVIRAKQAAARPKDLATLPILEQSLRVQEAMERDD